MAQKPVFLFAALAITLSWVSDTRAHVAPSVDKNNRYIKLELMGDRIRFAYTIFWGQLPGAQTRQRLDRNRNGTLEKTETEPFRKQIAQSVATALKVVIDGHSQSVQWAQAHMGLNTPDASAGAFSIDLVGWLCLDAPRKRKHHELELYDSYRLPAPGETELRVKDAPGTKILRSTIGNRKTSLLQFRWQGNGSKMAAEGYRLNFTVNPDEANIGMDDTCKKRQRKLAAASGDATQRNSGGSVSRWLVLLGAAGVIALAGVLVLLRRR